MLTTLIWIDVLADIAIQQESPLTDKGSVVRVFDDLSVRRGIKGITERINHNAKVL